MSGKLSLQYLIVIPYICTSVEVQVAYTTPVSVYVFIVLSTLLVTVAKRVCCVCILRTGERSKEASWHHSELITQALIGEASLLSLWTRKLCL